MLTKTAGIHQIISKKKLNITLTGLDNTHPPYPRPWSPVSLPGYNHDTITISVTTPYPLRYFLHYLIYDARDRGASQNLHRLQTYPQNGSQTLRAVMATAEGSRV